MALAFSVAPSNATSSISTQLTTNWGVYGAVCPELPNNIVAYVESIEVKGHLQARQASRSLALMRLSWGWYLNLPFGTASTTIEGYLADGTFGYRDTTGYDNDYSYTSHAHGWGTGPTDALTTYVVGIQLVSPGGQEWSLVPQLGDLESVEGGITTGLGKFSAGWTATSGGISGWWVVPDGTTGTVVVESASEVTIDGVAVTTTPLEGRNGLVSVIGSGGSHNISVVFSS